MPITESQVARMFKIMVGMKGKPKSKPIGTATYASNNGNNANKNIAMYW